MNAATLLRLGRVSNLPTVWTNVFAGAALAGGAAAKRETSVALLAGTLFYVGGMFLNDAFDADIDRKERPERPIPSGQAGRREVFVWGFSLLGLGVASLLSAFLMGLLPHAGALVAGVATALLVVAYDRWHKGLAWSPVLMGLCRLGLYVMAGLSAGYGLTKELVLSSLAVFLYVVGLTHVARFENGTRVQQGWVLVSLFAPLALALFGFSWGTDWVWLFLTLSAAWTVACLYWAKGKQRGSIGRAVVSLIAGLSLIDATLVATTGAVVLAIAACGGFALTLLLQRHIKGT